MSTNDTGQRVKHETLGEGEILSISTAPGKKIVRFDDGKCADCYESNLQPLN